MRLRSWLWLVVVLALVAAACGDDDSGTTTEAPGTTAATTTAPDVLTQTEGVLTVGSDIPFPPFEDFDDAGNVVGFDAELVNEMANRLGLTVEWVDTDFDTIFTQLATGQFDIVASATTITPERAAQVNFTDPYYAANQALTVNTAERPDLTSVADLGDGDRVAVQTGTTGAAWAADNLAPQGVEVVEFPGAPDTYNALEAGQVDGVIFDEPSAAEEASNRTGLEVVAVIETGEVYGFGVDPAREELLGELNRVFGEMLDDGTYQALYDTWFPDAPGGSVLFEEPGPAAIGTPENPIQVLFVPSVSAEEIIAGGELLADALNQATGLTYEVSVPTSYAATVEAMCASPENTIGMIPAQAYVLANSLCGVEVSLKSLRFGYTVYWTQFIVPRDSEIDTFEELEGATWAYPDATSTSGFLFPSGMFATAGFDPGESFEAGGHSATARAIYNGEADFGTTFYSPPTDSEGNVLWDGTPENADIPDDLVDDCALNDDGEIQCGDYIVQDARRNIREEAPDAVQKIRIVTLSGEVPNDTMSFSPNFPDDLKAQIVTAVKDFAANDPEGFGTAFDAYSWDDVADTTDAEFDLVRALLTAIGFDLEDL